MRKYGSENLDDLTTTLLWFLKFYSRVRNIYQGP